jgi:hypothetical protein
VDAATTDIGRSSRGAGEALPAWLGPAGGLAESVVPAAHVELSRRRSRAHTAVERLEARQAVYAEASRALGAAPEPFEARYRAAVALRSELLGSDDATSEYLQATTEQQQAGTEARPTAGDLAWTLPARIQAVVDETDRQSQRMEAAAATRTPRGVVLEENLAGYEAMMAAAGQGALTADEGSRDDRPRCGLEAQEHPHDREHGEVRDED